MGFQIQEINVKNATYMEFTKNNWISSDETRDTIWDL